MNIALLSMYFHPVIGGAETYVLKLAEGLVKNGHQVSVLCSNRTPDGNILVKSESYKGISIVRSPLILRNQGLYFPKMVNDPDVVHICSYGFFHAYYSVLRYVAISKIITLIGGELFTSHTLQPKAIVNRVLDRTIGLGTLLLCDKVVALTEYEKDFVSAHYKPISRDKITVLPLGVDEELFNDPLSNGIHLEFDYFLILGRADKRKRFQDALEAISYVPSVHLVWAGPIYDVAVKEELLGLAKRLNIVNRFHITGSVSDGIKKELIYNSLALIVTGQEAFSIVAAEAAACGKPVITNNLQPMPEIIINGWNGLIYRFGDVEHLGRLISLISSDQVLRRELGRNNRQLAEKKYRWPIIVRDTESLYKEVASSS